MVVYLFILLFYNSSVFALPHEEKVFAEAIQAFKSNNLNQLQNYSQLFLKTYPESPLADNILFLKGQLLQNTQKWSESIVIFDQVLIQYPHSNRAASALLAKAQSYRQLQLNHFALENLNLLEKKFKGCPEFYQVEAEKKLLLSDHNEIKR